MSEHKSLSSCPFCDGKLFLDIDEDGGVAILHSLKEKDCFFPSILEIEMPVGTTIEQMIEKINRRPLQESFEHALVGASLLTAARLQDKDFEIQNLTADNARLTAELAEKGEYENKLVNTVDFMQTEIDRLTASLHYANTVCMEQKHVIDRLKEDADSLASVVTGGVTQDAEEYWECPYCAAMAYNAGDIHHAPDCPITLHRALMKELDEGVG